MFRCGSLLLFGTLCLTASCGGPEPANLRVVPRPGQQVSLRDPDTGGRLRGKVLRIAADSITVERGPDTVRVSALRLADAEVVTSTTSGLGRGLGIGAIVGGTMGAVIGAAASANDDCSGECPYSDMALGGGILFGALGGALLGGVFGTASRIDMWSPAGRPGPAISFSADLMAGDAVRITGPRHREVGFVVGGSGEHALIRRGSGSDTLVDVQSIERYTGERSRVGKGLLYGAAAGAAMGLAIYVFEDEDGLNGPPTAGDVAAGTLLMSAMGAGIGALITRKPRQEWTRVGHEAESRVSLTPILRRERVGVLARVTW